MSVLDRFKKEEQPEKEEQKQETPPAVSEKTKQPDKPAVVSRKEQSQPVLEAPHVSEKGTFLAENNQYLFRVTPRANKPEIKKAIESLYKVKVDSVNIIKHPPRPKSLRGRPGYRTGYKKAVVTLKAGDKIEIAA